MWARNSPRNELASSHGSERPVVIRASKLDINEQARFLLSFKTYYLRILLGGAVCGRDFRGGGLDQGRTHNIHRRASSLS